MSKKKVINPFYAKLEIDVGYYYEGPIRFIANFPYWMNGDWLNRKSRAGSYAYERDYYTEHLGFRICLKRK